MSQVNEQLKTQLAYQFSNKDLLIQALTHRSSAENHNERLEFLGDAVLGLVMSGLLYKYYPEATEGQLSRLRSSLVRGTTLASVAKKLKLGDFMRFGAGEEKSGGKERESILAGCLEALIGAIYLDGGIEPSTKSIQLIFKKKLEGITLGDSLKDPKTRLQEYQQAKKQPLPIYHLISCEGKAHQQTFLVHCEVNEVEVTQGKGSSRRLAEQDAAEQTLEKLQCLEREHNGT